MGAAVFMGIASAGLACRCNSFSLNSSAEPLLCSCSKFPAPIRPLLNYFLQRAPGTYSA